MSHPLKTITVAALLAIALFALGIRWYSDRAVSTPPSAARATATNPDALPARAEATPSASATAALGVVEPPAALPARRSASDSFMPELRQAADAGGVVAFATSVGRRDIRVAACTGLRSARAAVIR